PNLKLVVIDTLNAVMHGDENSATVIAEFRREAFKLCTEELGVALVVTHHLRKPDAKTVIRGVDGMRNAIRGSTALPSAFRVVFGIWEDPDYEKRMPLMGLAVERGRIWMAAILKANNPEVFKGVKTLVRNHVGLLEDKTHEDRLEEVETLQGGSEDQAW